MSCYTIAERDYCLARVFTKEGDARFDPACDINGDGIIDAGDIILIGKNLCPEEKEIPWVVVFVVIAILLIVGIFMFKGKRK